MTVILLCSGFLFGCVESQSGEKTVIGEKPEVLNVYVVSDAVHVYYAEENKEDQYYTTLMSLGTAVTTTIAGERGFLFYEAFDNYQKETGIELNIQWFQYPEMMEAALIEAKESEMPDLIISNFTSRSDYYQYMNHGLFYDLTGLFEENEMYSNGKYYNQILRGGEYQRKQYIAPIMFTIDTVMGAEKQWDHLNLYLENAETSAEFVDVLIRAQKEQKIDQVACQFIEAAPSYSSNILYSASGERWADFENQTVALEKNLFNRMAVFYKGLAEEQLDSDKIVPGEKLEWAGSKQLNIIKMITNDVQIDEFMDEMGCIVEGGSSFKASLHSAAAQAWYYESRYRDLGEEFVITAIPGKEGGTTAHISYFGAVMKTSRYPRAAFDFIHYLMDEEVPVFFGMSVNQAITRKQISDLTSFAYKLHPTWLIDLKEGETQDGAGDYTIQPMSTETKDKLLTMIDEIETVTLPNWPAYAIIESQLQSYAKGEITVEEAYQNAVKGLKAYLSSELISPC